MTLSPVGVSPTERREEAPIQLVRASRSDSAAMRMIFFRFVVLEFGEGPATETLAAAPVGSCRTNSYR